jgi:S-layer protein (TIGR01567 family)
LDTKDTYTLTPNSSLPLKDGYALVANGISKGNDVVEFILLKSGKPVHAAIVSIGDTYVYKIDEVPIILVHLANAMSNGNSGFAEVDGVFQVSDEPDVKLFDGGRLGNLELTDLSEEGIEFQNAKSLTLTKDGEIVLADGLGLRVVDSDDLIYYPEGGIYDYGVHEIRGPAFTANSYIPVRLGDYNSSVIAKWDFGNYSGFYFDPEKNVGIEALVLYGIHRDTVFTPSNPVMFKENNTAFQDGFQYTSLIQRKQFEFNPWGYYYVINFLGEQWFAGYDSSLEGKTASKSLLEHEYLGKVLMDAKLRGFVLKGNYSLEDGYEMRIRDAGNDSIFLQLLKEGKLLDSSVVKSNSTYIYKKDLDNIRDMPIIMMHIGNVFNNGTYGFAALDGIFQISDRYILPVELGNGMGKMEIVAVRPDAIVMVNNEHIKLNRDSSIALLPGMNIRVADNDTLRYYLYTYKYVVPKPKPPLIKNPGKATASMPVNFTMFAPAAEIRQVTADILDSNNKTVWSKDLTALGKGSEDLWTYSWNWSTTVLRLSDDGSPILDANGGFVPGLFYLNQTSKPATVGIKFDPSGRIASISGKDVIYYVSPEEYSHLNTTMSYDAMLANDTLRRRLIMIEPDRSILQFLDVVDSRVVPSGANHTLTGSLENLEPHVVRTGAKPGRYELRVRVENAVNAIQAFGEFLNVTRSEMSGISIGSATVFAGDAISIPLETHKKGEKRINISYDPARLKAMNINSDCNSTWQIDSKKGMISVLLPKGCGEANLTFMTDQRIKENITAGLNVTAAIGLMPETIDNGTIAIVPREGSQKKSDAPGFLISAFVILCLFVLARRKG